MSVKGRKDRRGVSCFAGGNLFAARGKVGSVTCVHNRRLNSAEWFMIEGARRDVCLPRPGVDRGWEWAAHLAVLCGR